MTMAPRVSAEFLINTILSSSRYRESECQIVFVRSDSRSAIRQIALDIATRHPKQVPAYKITPSTAFAPQVASLPNLRDAASVDSDSFWSMPMVLLIEDFDSLECTQQRNYCHLADGEFRTRGLPSGSILLCGFTGKGIIEPGSISRGRLYELD